ncbi:outer membrane protein precursor CzcC [methanotrophic bacterial endosymbiont of Bathymodiolus sp.]|jgi:hypothetical protein|nr:outer membrane protein precursor CzcC [methanotrophic bacterial endosymbiont of Bathymodiolus sp.]
MISMAIHMRISGVTVSDEDVKSRSAAATSLASSWRKEKNVSNIVDKVANIANSLGRDCNPPPLLGSEVQGAIQKKSPSFLFDERPLEVSICAGVAMISILSGSPSNIGWTNADVYAAALWSSLAYQPVLEAERREKLRMEVLEVARTWSVTSSEKARQRIVVPDPKDIEIMVDESKAVTSNIKEAVADTIEALRRNAALDREELDFLWWAQLGRSRLLNKQLSAIDEPTRIVAAGIEGARILRRLPCEVHKEIVLRTLDQDQELDLETLLAVIGDDRTVLGAEFVNGYVAAHPTVFPLLHSLATGEIDDIGAAVKRRVSEWGERALLEAGFVRMLTNGAVNL